MPTIQSAGEVLDRHYLEIRCSMLDIAAALDRISRSDQTTDLATDPRLERIHQALKILADAGTDRAERLQILFSDPYQQGWNRPAQS